MTTLAVARKQAPDSTHRAKRDGARGAQTDSPQRRGSFPVPFIQRKASCACGGGCPRCKEHPIPANPETVPPIVHEVLRSPGQPLDLGTRAFMEPRFGHDFSRVRVHTDARAAVSARAVNALAYTVGRDVVFGVGQYTLGTAVGQQLLAHELTHVVQQRNASALRNTQLRMGQENDALEAKAEMVSQNVGMFGSLHGSWMQNRNTTITASVTNALRLQRQLIGPELIGPEPGLLPTPPVPAAGPVPRNIRVGQRAPDITSHGFHTWYVRMGNVDRAFVFQIGRQPGSERVSITFASLRPGMRNPELSRRTMVLAISPSATLAPRITDESETTLPDGVSFQKVITVELNEPGTKSHIVTIILQHSFEMADVPFIPKEMGGSPYWGPARIESGWLAASDGYREISVNFPGVYPSESLMAEGSRPFVHPRLGFGYVHPERGFVPYPYGRPLISAATRQRLGEEFSRTGIHLIPVVGPLVMIGEALIGRSIWGRRLSTTERAILGAGALLAEIGPLIRAGRAAVVASRLSTVAGVSQVQALRMIMTSRALTAADRATLERLSAEIRAGRALSEADQALANRLIGKMSEHLRVVATRAEVEAVTGVARQPGRFHNLGTSMSADEARVGQALARDLNADVVRPLESTVSGVKNPDYILDDVVAELYSPRTGNIEKLIRKGVEKHKQAGIIVIDLTNSSVPAATALGSTGRFFGRPEFADVGRLIFVQGDRVIGQAFRPTTSSLAPTIVQGGASAAAAVGGEEEE